MKSTPAAVRSLGYSTDREDSPDEEAETPIA